MSDKIQVKGTVEAIGEVQTFASGFKKQMLVVNTGGKYPQTIPVEFAKDKIELIANLRKGQEVCVSVNIRGNEFQGKYYCSLSGWEVEHNNVKMHGGEKQVQSGHNEAKPNAYQPQGDDGLDEIPF